MSLLRFLEAGQDRLGRRGFLAGLALVGAATLAACSSGGGAPSSSSNDNAAATAAAKVSGGLNSEAKAAQSAGATVVKMTDQNTFDPASITVAKGTTVTWQNGTSTVHSATFDPSKVTNKADVSLPDGVQPFDSGLLQAGQSWSHTFADAGTYHYTCIPHESLGMHGTVIVQ